MSRCVIGYFVVNDFYYRAFIGIIVVDVVIVHNGINCLLLLLFLVRTSRWWWWWWIGLVGLGKCHDFVEHRCCAAIISDRIILHTILMIIVLDDSLSLMVTCCLRRINNNVWRWLFEHSLFGTHLGWSHVIGDRGCCCCCCCRIIIRFRITSTWSYHIIAVVVGGGGVIILTIWWWLIVMMSLRWFDFNLTLGLVWDDCRRWCLVLRMRLRRLGCCCCGRGGSRDGVHLTSCQSICAC